MDIEFVDIRLEDVGKEVDEDEDVLVVIVK